MQRLLAVLTVVALAASGCSDDAETPGGAEPSSTSTVQTATTSSSPTTTTSADATASTNLAPVSYPEGATYVAGRITGFLLSEGTVTTNEDGTSQSRDGTINYTLISNDARVAGTVTGTWHSDRWGTQFDGAIIQWGEATITNENGTWEAAYDGIWTSSLGDVITRWWRGTGDYEGLTFYMAATGNVAWEWVGLIFPGAPPPRP